ncbi:RNA polymerase II degradation factor 1 [Manduca sexta]|uniref:RNA polymerase II degradation factor 1 n=1 Tax=Manduca sexta TaxID=7130 RepID=UPI00188EC336|nr:RNA polymerase II degradation factor 1 [Manduca sexta]
MKFIVIFALVVCVHATSVDDTDKGKRQTEEELVPTHYVYRSPRKQEQAAPVEEPQQEDDKAPVSRSDGEEYRPGQVFSLNPQELLELQPERKAPLSSNQLLQQLYSNPQAEHKQGLQQFYYLEPQGQVGRQVALQPSHAVIARPNYSSNGGEASVGAALSVSDTGAASAESFDQELLALLGQAPVRPEEPRKQAYIQSTQTQQASTVQSVAPQYQQVDRYVTKPSKKPSKLRSKVQIAPPQIPAAPQQYLIETTNINQQQPQQFRPAPQPQQQRVPQVLRYVPFQQAIQQQSIQQQSVQQPLYEHPESQGLKVVAAPKLQQLQQPKGQLNYRLIPQYQPEAVPKQYRIIEAARPQFARQEQRLQSPSVERPVTYLKRYPEPEKLRSVKIYDPVFQESLQQQQQPAQILGEQYLLRPVYRTNDQRPRYELPPLALKPEQQRVVEQGKPQSSIYVSKNLAPRKLARPQPLTLKEQNLKIEQPAQQQEQVIKHEQPSNVEQVNIEQHGQSLEEQRSHLPPPKNNKAYTPEEFAALVAAGYAVTPIPVSALNLDVAQSRSAVEQVTLQPVTAQPKRRPISRHQYLPLRGDDAP